MEAAGVDKVGEYHYCYDVQSLLLCRQMNSL